jgi:hypothetical protein
MLTNMEYMIVGKIFRHTNNIRLLFISIDDLCILSCILRKQNAMNTIRTTSIVMTVLHIKILSQ